MHFCLTCAAIPMLIVLYKMMGSPDRADVALKMDVEKLRKHQFGGNGDLPEGCREAPLRSAVAVMNKVFSKGHYETGFFKYDDHKDKYPVTVAVCKMGNPALQIVAPVVWVGKFHKGAFPTNLPSDQTNEQYRTSSGFYIQVHEDLTLGDLKCDETAWEFGKKGESIVKGVWAIGNKWNFNRITVLSHDASGKSLVETILLTIKNVKIVSSFVLNIKLWVVVFQMIAIGRKIHYTAALAAWGLRSFIEFFGHASLSGIPEMFLFILEVKAHSKRDVLDKAIVWIFLANDAVSSVVEWIPLLRVVVMCIALGYLTFVIVEHFLPTDGPKRKISPYIIIKMISILSLCPNDIYIIANLCQNCGVLTSVFGTLRMYLEPIRFSHLTTDLTLKFVGFDYLWEVKTSADTENVYCDFMVLFFWIIFTLRKVVVYLLVNSFRLSKLSKFSEINFVVMFYFWFNLEGGLWNLIKTEFVAHYIIFLGKQIYVAVKEEIQDDGDDEDDSIGIGAAAKSGFDKVKDKTKKE